MALHSDTRALMTYTPEALARNLTVLRAQPAEYLDVRARLSSLVKLCERVLDAMREDVIAHGTVMGPDGRELRASVQERTKLDTELALPVLLGEYEYAASRLAPALTIKNRELTKILGDDAKQVWDTLRAAGAVEVTETTTVREVKP